jgi:putative salt-induced outer membrane protein YdiY
MRFKKRTTPVGAGRGERFGFHPLRLMTSIFIPLTFIAGVVGLAVSAVAAAAGAATLVLANGDVLTGEVVEWAVDHVVLEHPQLGRMRIDLDKLQLDTGKPPSPGLFDTTFMRGWRRRIQLGMNSKQGNSVNTDITSALKLDYEDDWTRWKFDGRYYYFRDDDGDNDNNGRFDLRRDWLFPDSRWFASVGSRYQFDQFESWKHRITVFAGPSLYLVRREAHELDAFLGPAFTREFGESGEDKFEGMFGLNYKWTVSERNSLTFSNNLFVETDPNAGSLRNFTSGTWSIAITAQPALSLNLGFENEYESEPGDGDKSNDLLYFVRLGLDL